MVRPIKVLFICVGNACRSPMAEKMCDAYGRGIITADSAGIHPSLPHILVDQNAIGVMKEIGIDMSAHTPKHVGAIRRASFDVLVNMSWIPGNFIAKIFSPTFKGKIIEWGIDDPRGESDEFYRRVRDILKEKVLVLIQELTEGK